MAEAAIFHLMATFAPFIQDEFQLLSGVREEIVHIRDEFERMTTFLGVVEANGEHHPQLKVCVRQVREASYEAGDVLEQFMLRLNHRDGDGIYGFLRKASYFVTTFKVRHQVAIKIRRIKLRLGDISEGHQRYLNLLSTIEQGSGSQTVHNGSWYDSRGDALLLEDHEIVGIEGPRSKIIKWLGNEDYRLQVLSVLGMGGMGKTTLVKKVFDNIETRKIFQTLAWITVSENFKVDELLKDIIKQLYEGGSKKVPEGVEKMDNNHLKATINDFLRQKRYLIVIDDVWHTLAWQALKCAFPDGNQGSRVILTTRFANIASSSCKEYHGEVHNIVHLSEKNAWTLFCLKAFQGQSYPSHLEGISRDILKKCEGMPLAIVAIGGLLSMKDQGSIDEWDRVYRTLGIELQGNVTLQSLKKILLLSYIDLPYHLKVCFLYLSIYPENYLIDHWRLVRLLIAEGFVEPKQGMTIEEVAASYLMELENRSLILVEKLSMKGTVKAYHIHGMWRETITPKSMEQNLVTIVGARLENNWTNKVRRLSIHDGFQNWQEIKHITNQLRSLLIFGSIDEKSASLLLATLKNGARILKVLDFRGSPLTTLPGKTMKLPNLKYLSLRGTDIKEIPKSIGNLQMLETLDLKDTLVTVLPDEITKLKRLRHLLVYRYLHEPFYLPFDDQIGFRAVKEIGNFSCLQKLCSIELNQGIPDLAIIIEIGKLTQLRRINILKVKSENGIELCSSLEKLRDLRSLSIGATNADEIINLESLSSPPQFLQTLVVKGRLEKFPLWITSLHNVVKLHLRHSKLKDNPLKPLQDLPNLAELLLEQAYEGELLSFKTGGFRRLKKLVLDSLSGLRSVIVIEGAMPELEKLYIFGCALLDEFPSGIESLSCLKDLQLIDLSDALISKLNRDMPNGDYQRITHISKVLVGGFTDGRWRRHHL